MEIHTIDLKFQDKERAIAAYLLEEGDKRILIETGPESTRPCLIKELKQRGCEPRDLSAVFVTHIHLDHSGAAWWFSKEGVPVYVHPKGAKHLIDPSRLVESARMVYADAFDSLWGETREAPAEAVVETADRDVHSFGGIEIETLETPGHAYHHNCYRVGGAVFAGDAAGARISKEKYTSVTSAPPQFHFEKTLSSLELLRSLEPERLFLTHFGEISDPMEHLSAYREAVELNVGFIKERLIEKMDNDSLQIAYQAFNLEQAFRDELPSERWEAFQLINSSAMCADGIRLYWEKQMEAGA